MHLRGAERLWAIGDVNGRWPLTHVGKYEGEVVAANILGNSKGELRGRSAGGVHGPASRGRGGCRRSLQRDGPGVGGRQDRHLHARLSRMRTASSTLLSDGERLTGAYALGPEAGEWLQQATLAIGRTSARCPRRHDPAVPHVLGDLRRRAEGASGRDRGRTSRSARARPWRADGRTAVRGAILTPNADIIA